MDIVELDLSDGSRCRINLFGATVTSWLCHSQEMIFVSAKSHFDNKKAIRGGIPIVFPNFGPWNLGPQHGFGRITKWSVGHGPEKTHDGCSVSATLELEDNDTTRKMWNYKFKLQYVVTLTSDTLSTRLIVKNMDTESFSFTCLLHTYFQVPDVQKVSVSGLKGLQYTDKVEGGKKAVEEREFVTIASAVDRVYEKTSSEHVITEVAGRRKIILKKDNLPDTVVWNPWKEKAAEMSDFGDDEYPNMVCVEAGYVAERKELLCGETFCCGQVLVAKI